MAVIAACPPTRRASPRRDRVGVARSLRLRSESKVFFELPPEMAKEMEEARERHMLQAELGHREVRRFLHNLTAEQAQVMWNIFTSLTSTDDDALRHVICSDWQGYLRGLLEYKFGLCVCGRDHDHDDDPSVLLAAKQRQEDDDDGEMS